MNRIVNAATTTYPEVILNEKVPNKKSLYVSGDLLLCLKGAAGLLLNMEETGEGTESFEVIDFVILRIFVFFCGIYCWCLLLV